MSKDVDLVTVVCLTYNHAVYVADALNGFLKQETDFSFSVLVHDDASTDGTADIIRRYGADHPDVIKPILQAENQFSKGVRIIAQLLSGISTEYVALCEGDDYWTDPTKLQRQIDWLRANPDGSLCGHATLMVDPDGSPLKALRIRDGDGEVPVEQILVNHDLLHTSSLVFRADLGRELPDYYYLAPVGDRPVKMHLATSGRVYYLDSVMSHYRYGVPGSWTASMGDPGVALRHAVRTVSYLEEFDRHTGGRHSETVDRLVSPFRRRILSAELDQAMREGRYRDLTDPRFAQVSGQRIRLVARAAATAPKSAQPAITRVIMTMPSVNALGRRLRREVTRIIRWRRDGAV